MSGDPIARAKPLTLVAQPHAEGEPEMATRPEVPARLAAGGREGRVAAANPAGSAVTHGHERTATPPAVTPEGVRVSFGAQVAVPSGTLAVAARQLTA